MPNENHTPNTPNATRHYVRVVASAGALVLLQVPGLSDTVLHRTFENTGDIRGEQPGTDAYTLPEAEPVRLSIPALGIDTAFEAPLGLNEDNTIEVPNSFEAVGWYQYGPTPGELGPAVVLGHVDSYDGPAVFYSLGQLAPGDEIAIERQDGTTAVFTVTALERHEQSGFPTEKVYGDIDHAGLRLVTCSGTYDRETLRYSHNLIVFASLQTHEG